jgi:DNA-binding MarR family transcriptional regulator
VLVSARYVEIGLRVSRDMSGRAMPRQDGVFSDELHALARLIYDNRRTRSELFEEAMFGEPAWDMLLALYVAEGQGRQQTVSRITSWADAPQTTALRWLEYLERENLISREANPLDRRSVFLKMTDKGRATLEDYLKRTLAELQRRDEQAMDILDQLYQGPRGSN